MAVGRLNKEQKRISRIIMGLQVKQGRYRKRIKELDDKILHLKYIKEQKGFIKVFM